MPYTLTIEQDDSPLNPRTDFDNFGKMALVHPRYSLHNDTTLDIGDYLWRCRTQEGSFDLLKKDILKHYEVVVILPVYLYDHSGLLLNTAPFTCPWDSMQVGFIFMERKSILKAKPGYSRITKKLKDWAEKILKLELTTYSQYLNGDVWDYVIKDETGEVVDSCCGFYGLSYCRVAGEEVLHALATSEPKQLDIFEVMP